jgi:hypothetical protein
MPHYELARAKSHRDAKYLFLLALVLNEEAIHSFRTMVKEEAVEREMKAERSGEKGSKVGIGR